MASLRQRASRQAEQPTRAAPAVPTPSVGNAGEEEEEEEGEEEEGAAQDVPAPAPLPGTSGATAKRQAAKRRTTHKLASGKRKAAARA